MCECVREGPDVNHLQHHPIRVRGGGQEEEEGEGESWGRC